MLNIMLGLLSFGSQEMKLKLRQRANSMISPVSLLTLAIISSTAAAAAATGPVTACAKILAAQHHQQQPLLLLLLFCCYSKNFNHI